MLLQDSGDRYTLNSIYKDESQCPAVQYKCRRGGRGRPLVWQRQDSDTFKGDMGTIGSNKEGKMQIFSILPTTLSIAYLQFKAFKAFALLVTAANTLCIMTGGQDD